MTLLAAAKIGLHVYDIDTKISKVQDVRDYLTESKCKAIIFEPVNEEQDNLKLLRKAIPEFFECNYYDLELGLESYSPQILTMNLYSVKY